MPAHRESLLSTISDELYDTVVIGGGITGVCAAWEAAERGLRVLLLERADFGAATSAHSLKILHGGIRYLQHLDIPRLRQSCGERSTFLNMAPHLTSHKPFVVPTYGQGLQGKNAFRAALVLLKLLTADRNRGIADPEQKIPVGHTISRYELDRRFPGLTGTGATGAAVFHDGVLLNPPRLVFEIVQTAIAAGAVALNYCSVERVRIDETRNMVSGVEFRDVVTGQQYEIRTKSVINAAGPFAPGVKLSRSIDSPDAPYSRDMAFVVRQLFDDPAALAIQTRYKDPDAVLSRGNRHLFMVPWRNYTLIGVNSRIYRNHPDALYVDDTEIEDFLDEINEACPQLGLSRDDVRVVNAGLLPFGENPASARHLSFGKRSLIYDGAKDGGPHGYAVAISVRWTMGRRTAQSAVDVIETHLRGYCSDAVTPRRQIRSCGYDNVSSLRQVIRRDLAFRNASPAQIDSIVMNSGNQWQKLRTIAASQPELLSPIGNTSTFKAQVVYSARHEMVTSLADIVMRRTDLGSGEQPDDATLASCADLVAGELEWSDNRTRQEIASVRRLYPFAVDPHDSLPDRMAI